MITIKRATHKHRDVVALLGRITYKESHGHYITNKDDLKAYLDAAFSVNKIHQEIEDTDNLFYIIYHNETPVGYAKLRLNSYHKSLDLKKSCQLERIYILTDFIPLKLGQQLLEFLEEQTLKLQFNTLWLSVYIENKRAIRFYEKNRYQHVGKTTFTVHGTVYENNVFQKQLQH